MYINKNKHILSNYILTTAVVKIAMAIMELYFRMKSRREPSLLPYMLDRRFMLTQCGLSTVRITIILITFCFAWRKLKRCMRVVKENENDDITMLQKEYLKDKLSSLSAASISRLLQLWAAIFIGIEVIYTFSSIMYRRFIIIMLDPLAAGGGLTDGTFKTLYNMTHGFKYLEVLIALLLGLAMTGIFLHDKLLKLTAIVITVVFLAAFAAFHMQTITFMGKEIGVVWTSILYHGCETIGLALLSLYLSIRYKGL